MDRQGYKYAIGFLRSEISSTYEDFEELGEDRKMFEVSTGPNPIRRIVVLCNQSPNGYIPLTDEELAERTIIREILPVEQETPAQPVQLSKEGYRYMLPFTHSHKGEITELLGPDQKWIPVRFTNGFTRDGYVVLCNRKSLFHEISDEQYAGTTLR